MGLVMAVIDTSRVKVSIVAVNVVATLLLLFKAAAAVVVAVTVVVVK